MIFDCGLLLIMLNQNSTTEAFMLYVGLTNGGFGWIPNLTDVDHSFILPISMAFANLAIIQVI